MPFAAKLTPQLREAVRLWAAFGVNKLDVARRLGVSHQTIRRVIVGGKKSRKAA